MTLGERIITSAWIATREHLLGEHNERQLLSTTSGRLQRIDPVERWSDSRFDSGDEDEPEDGHVREGAD